MSKNQLINLVDENERNVFEFAEGVEIYYRRVPQIMMNTWQRRYTNARGVTDWTRVSEEAIKYAALGWKGFADKGKVVEFSPELLMRLPGEIVLDFSDLLGVAIPRSSEKVSAEKN